MFPEAGWIELNDLVQWFLVGLRTRGFPPAFSDYDAVKCHHISSAAQLFSGQTYYHEEIMEQQLLLKTQQGLIEQQAKRLAKEEAARNEKNKQCLELQAKLEEIMKENEELKNNNLKLKVEVEWQKEMKQDLSKKLESIKKENEEIKLLLFSEKKQPLNITCKSDDEDKCDKSSSTSSADRGPLVDYSSEENLESSFDLNDHDNIKTESNDLNVTPGTNIGFRPNLRDSKIENLENGTDAISAMNNHENNNIEKPDDNRNNNDQEEDIEDYIKDIAQFCATSISTPTKVQVTYDINDSEFNSFNVCSSANEFLNDCHLNKSLQSINSKISQISINSM